MMKHRLNSGGNGDNNANDDNDVNGDNGENRFNGDSCNIGANGKNDDPKETSPLGLLFKWCIIIVSYRSSLSPLAPLLPLSH